MIPELSPQTRGWLRFVWQKATTADDWSSEGTPHPWWDRDSTAPMCAFPRFDLGETSYILPVVADVTPAWREAYTRIADELVGRHTTFWAAIDWLTMIGHDPDQRNYPPEWQIFLPERLRGRYDAPGWVANGVAPWGLQPDPIGADGNLFFRGFFNLLLSVYRSVSGSEKWEKPFAVTGYQNRRFDWTHREVASFIHDQWKERPQGPNCENTKIWPFCLSAAGLGLQLYDRVTGSAFHGVYDEWVEFAKKHYLVKDSRGNVAMFPLYYDPLEDEICSFPDPLVALSTLVITPYVLPQAPEFGRYLYEQSVRKLGWDDAARPFLDLLPDPRFLTVGLLIARELGDATTEKRLRQAIEQRADPRWFGDAENQFGYWFGLDEPYPRGQLSALLMVCEAGEPGSWCRAFREPNRTKLDEPTVEGIDYPAVDVLRAWNDTVEGVLHLGLAIGEPARRGAATTFRVTHLREPGTVEIRCDEQPFSRWRVVGDDAIEVETEIGDHAFRIATRARRRIDPAERSRPRASGGTDGGVAAGPQGVGTVESPRTYVAESVGKCSCC